MDESLQPKSPVSSAKPPKVMQTVDKALGLLHYFSVSKPELGLSELARMAGLDKATTLRCLAALERNGFVEQHPESKKYRLGLSFLQLARIREISFPVTDLIQPIINRLAEETGETAHASMLSGNELVSIAIAEPGRSIRVFLDQSEHLPLHATATGIVMLAFASDDVLARIPIDDELKAYTPNTIRSREMLDAAIASARAQGFANVNQAYEEGVVGTAYPVFDRNGHAIGTVAVASVSTRYNDEVGMRVQQALEQAAAEITRQLGGVKPTPRAESAP